jgi:hypothetical protein
MQQRSKYTHSKKESARVVSGATKANAAPAREWETGSRCSRGRRDGGSVRTVSECAAIDSVPPAHVSGGVVRVRPAAGRDGPRKVRIVRPRKQIVQCRLLGGRHQRGSGSGSGSGATHGRHKRQAKHQHQRGGHGQGQGQRSPPPRTGPAIHHQGPILQGDTGAGQHSGTSDHRGSSRSQTQYELGCFMVFHAMQFVVLTDHADEEKDTHKINVTENDNRSVSQEEGSAYAFTTVCWWCPRPAAAFWFSYAFRHRRGRCCWHRRDREGRRRLRSARGL